MSTAKFRAKEEYAKAGCEGAVSEDGWVVEEFGVRCWFCMAVVGSVADPCKKLVEAARPTDTEERGDD